MTRRHLYLAGGVALLATFALIADRTTELRKYVLPNKLTAEGKMQLPNGWRVTPAGRHIRLPGDLPMKMAITPDGKLLVNTGGWHDHNVDVIDIRTEKLEQSFDVGKNWDGMSYDAASNTLYVSSGGTPKKGWDTDANNLKRKIDPEVRASFLKPVMRLRYASGRLALDKPVSIRGVEESDYYISGVTAKGGALFVLEVNRNKIYRLSGDGFARQSVGDTGPRPYSAELSPDGKVLAVSNWGGESVSLLDPQSLKETARIHTGSHPNEMAWHGDRLFVANSGSNSVSVIDDGKVVETIKTTLDPKALVGSTPDALAISRDGSRLYVANADNNDVAVVDISKKDDAKVLGLIPTGWYPTALALSPDGAKLFIGTGKGLEFAKNYPMSTDFPRPYPDPKKPYDYIGGVLSGAVSVVDVPDTTALAAYTKQVLGNFPAPAKEVDAKTAQAIEKNVFPKIKHVIYIIRENRTYDQVFGDLGIGNGDSSITMFGKAITPNAHALARRFVTLDNLYCNGEVSEDGHQWCDAAYATDFTQKAWTNSYSKRGEPHATPELVASPAGYLWDNCRQHGVSFRSYGEGRIVESTPESTPTMDLKGALLGHVATDWPRNAFVARDYNRVDLFIRDMKQAEQQGAWPQFMIMGLGENHTEGLAGGKYTPAAHVASNDLGLAKLVEAVSRSKFWPETAIFVIEDDAQNGPDHVDAHRTVGLVISPYVKRQTLDSTMYTTASMIRTMELILGLPPMTQFDQLATPMYNSFTPQADLSVIPALPETTDMEAKNPVGGPLDSASRHLDFSDFDKADPDELNRILWLAMKPGKEMPAPVRSARLIWR